MSDSQALVSGLDSPLWYSPVDGHFDEVFLPDQSIRPHWQYLTQSLTALGSQALSERHRKAQQILRDDGATYNLKSDPMASNVWALDPIPLVISSGEWATVEAGLIERSELMNLILQDIYGSRELIKLGIVPAEVIYSHPGFLRQCDGIKMPGEHQLILHATDMVRLPDGSPCIVGDRTQAPSGAGYALENRTVMSRIMPSMFRDSQVHRLALFFQALRTRLATLCEHSDSPTIVILTPGAHSETYFEHAYLSNYLGYPLVQGSDLTVRGGKVWLKSLNGLTQVDVILRRVDDVYCDQVELRSNSYLGVPGLVEAVRSGNVVVANPLGSGILEHPALLKYLPAISQHFLGRQLQIPSVDTWWCGNAEDMAYVAANLSQLIIKPSVRRHDNPSVYGHELSLEQQQALLKKIRQTPYQYVAQSYVSPSIMPSWDNQQLKARPLIFRSFTVSNQVSYTAMAGGLTRVGTDDGDTVVTQRAGSQSKDTWIIASEPEKQISLIEQRPADHPAARQTNLPSRVVENLFWMGRYAERAEASLRLLRTTFVQLYGIDPLPIRSRNILLTAISQQTGTQGFTDDEPSTLEQPDAELIRLVVDGQYPGSVKANLLSMLSCSEEVKEMLSADTRKIVNNLRDQLHELDRAFINGLPSAADESLDPLVTTLLALSGVNNESMLRGTGWIFQEIGRRTERALQTATLLRSLLTPVLPETEQQQMLESILLSMEALISFRRRYRTSADVSRGLDLLMIEETNPRSLIYQLERLRQYIDALPRSETFTPGLSHEKRLLVKSLSDIQLTDLETVVSFEADMMTRDALEALMTQLIDQLETFTTLISKKYFDHTAGPQQLNATQWENTL